MMLANMKDNTPHNQVHQTDLQLMQYFNVMSGRVVIISLREQTARFYQDGQLVNWSYVTTGRPELPSVPGWHTAMWKVSPTTFRSPDPVGSPNYYQPTHINYAIAYNAGGYFLHDAWWRSWFGPNSNLPHYDPAAFNGGSHGCVNFPLANMKWVYNWTPQGAPIILY
jgi:lipoprotein-anchoring transpeptidase ErfK/SrfK